MRMAGILILMMVGQRSDGKQRRNARLCVFRRQCGVGLGVVDGSGRRADDGVGTVTMFVNALERRSRCNQTVTAKGFRAALQFFLVFLSPVGHTVESKATALESDPIQCTHWSNPMANHVECNTANAAELLFDGSWRADGVQRSTGADAAAAGSM